jgi:hypothetical protein
MNQELSILSFYPIWNLHRGPCSATEAKTSALQDLDIRSTYSPLVNQATGTGTDNIIVVGGKGDLIDNTGGHTKMGELIAKAVYEGVREAIYKQNGLLSGRNVFQRLKDRKISIYELVSGIKCDCVLKKSELVSVVEEILIDPRYAGFIESSFALSDDYERGLIVDLSAHEFWCKSMAEEIAGEKIESMTDLITIGKIPIVVRMSLNAIFNGLYFKKSCNH